MDSLELDHRFAFHPARDEEKRNAHSSVRMLLASVASDLNGRPPEGREKSVAFTKLEEATFWANAALARQQGS